MDFVVARRVLEEEEDVVTLEPVYFILAVPQDTDVKEIKEVLEKSGEARSQEWNWREFRVVSEQEWGTGRWSIDPEKWVRDNQDPYEPSPPWLYGTNYDWLADSIHGERRISLRLPMGLYVALSQAATNKGATLNSFCIGALASVVGYGDVEEFEKQRRKPGRPKKVQDSE